MLDAPWEILSWRQDQAWRRQVPLFWLWNMGQSRATACSKSCGRWQSNDWLIDTQMIWSISWLIAPVDCLILDRWYKTMMVMRQCFRKKTNRWVMTSPISYVDFCSRPDTIATTSTLIIYGLVLSVLSFDQLIHVCGVYGYVLLGDERGCCTPIELLTIMSQSIG